MKKKGLLSKIAWSLVLLSGIWEVQGQSCSINTNVNGIGGTATATNNIGQSFTACGSGTLSTIKIGVISTNSATGIVKIFAGEGTSGAVLGQGAVIALSKNRTNTWDLNSLNIKVVSGQKYTALFLATGSGGVYPSFEYGTYAAADYYAGGRVINYGAANNDMFFSATITQLTPVLTPLHLADNVSRVTPMTLQFDRAMKANTGSVSLKNITTNAITTISVADLIISGSLVKIPYTNILDLNTQYEITIPSTALSATSGISFAGIAATKWTFTTSNKAVPVIASTLGTLTNSTSIPFTINFSEDVTGFDASDLTITNGTASNFSGSGKSYSVTITPTTSGNVSLQVPGDVTTEGNELASKTVFFDNIAPVVITKNITVQLDAAGNGSITVAGINNGTNDNDTQNNNLVLSLDKSTFTCSDLGSKTVTLSAADSAGNVGTANATVTVVPKAPTVIAKNITVQLTASGIVSILPADVNNNSSSYCNTTLAYSLSKSTFTCSDLGADTITLTGDDGKGNSVTATSVVTVQNKVLPTAKAKNISAKIDINTGVATITPQMIDNGSAGNCSGVLTLSLSKSTFTCAETGNNAVVLTVTDEQGNSATATATVNVLPGIDDENLTATQPVISPGASTSITTNSSLAGVNYTLRNDNGNVKVGATIPGTGNPLTFNTGILNSTQTFNVLGESDLYGNAALDFDGTNDIINTNVTLAATSKLTIEAWVFPRAATHNRLITNFTNTAVAGEFIFDTYNATNNGRGLRFYLKGTTTVNQTVTAANVLTSNAWNHVAATFDSGAMKIYVNGILVGSATAAFTTIPACSNLIKLGEDVVIGAAEYFNGKMDDVRIWNTARTAAEITADMNNCLTGNEAGLKTYFKISEGTGTTITDLKAGLKGTMSGMDPATDWVPGIVNCVVSTCEFEMSDLVTIQVGNITGQNNAEDLNTTITISPNPVLSELTIQSDLEILKVNIYTVLGDLIFTGSENKTNVSELTSGIYIVELTTSAGIFKSRFVKE